MMTRRLIATAALPFALQRIGKGSGKDWPPGTVSCFRTGADALGIGQITGGYRLLIQRLAGCSHRGINCVIH